MIQMIPWLFVTAIFVLQGLARILAWPSSPLPIPLAIGLSVLLGALAWSTAKPVRPGLVIVGLAIVSDAVARLLGIPLVFQGVIRIAWAGAMLLYTFRGGFTRQPMPMSSSLWWKCAALVGLAVFLLLPPGSCG